MSEPRIAGLILAAGAGRRFGGPKQLAELNGRPLLEHAVRAMAAAVDRVVVVLGARADEVVAGADLRGAEVVVCAGWADGMSASLRCGLAALGDVDEVVVALASEASYIGAMGSRRAQASRRERLLAQGVAEDALTRISAPIGLDLGALTAEETALSIMAEIVACKHGHGGGRLMHASGRIHEVGV